MVRAYLKLDALTPVQLASKAQFVIQKMMSSNYCIHPPVLYHELESKIELLMTHIIQEEMGVKGAANNIQQVEDTIKHILNSYVEYVQMQSHGDERIITKCGMQVKTTSKKVSSFTARQKIKKNLKALSVIAAML